MPSTAVGLDRGSRITDTGLSSSKKLGVDRGGSSNEGQRFEVVVTGPLSHVFSNGEGASGRTQLHALASRLLSLGTSFFSRQVQPRMYVRETDSACSCQHTESRPICDSGVYAGRRKFMATIITSSFWVPRANKLSLTLDHQAARPDRDSIGHNRRAMSNNDAIWRQDYDYRFRDGQWTTDIGPRSQYWQSSFLAF